MSNERLSIRDWWDRVGNDKAMAAAHEAGTSFEYFRFVAYRMRPCTPEMFERLEAAARKLTPGIAPDFEVSCRPSARAAELSARASNRTSGRGRRVSRSPTAGVPA